MANTPAGRGAGNRGDRDPGPGAGSGTDPQPAAGAATHFDVFLSHRFADKAAVEALYRRIRRLGHSVYVDWKQDPGLDRSRVDPDTAEHFRRVMRRCHCLVFLAGPNAPGSKWMPWELGFFDGRHGARRIGVYVDDRRAFDAGEQEYLGLYETIDAATLPRFIDDAIDDTASMTSATADQFARHLERWREDPMDYALSVWQWCFGVSANLLIDPARMQSGGDGQPSGPLREPAALWQPWYDLWRAQQDALALQRQQARAARRQAGAPRVTAGAGAAARGGAGPNAVVGAGAGAGARASATPGAPQAWPWAAPWIDAWTRGLADAQAAAATGLRAGGAPAAGPFDAVALDAAVTALRRAV